MPASGRLTATRWRKQVVGCKQPTLRLLGLAPLIVQQVFRIVADIRARGTTVLLVEQNAHMALSVADRGYVLETGRLLLSGTLAEPWNDPKVAAAYLGELATLEAPPGVI